ncbi:MAG: Hsp70 family protein [bacterium]|jgi:molecular chaperone DnaK|nr:Hsp70 family protein [candidate division KSB1 bacterium]MDH7560457.1 Hsp70 family protein [bacterium]
MERETIDFGIDLGTTNSEIAVLKGTEVEVFRNNERFEYTPSAVWIDQKARLWVGRQAKERLEDDPENASCEFKLQMGTGEEMVFSRSGRRMKPEELSAEVLKELRKIVKQRTGEDIEAAVITVPAAFELPQTDATKRAAQLAGLRQSPLVQEPVAAALAYGFQSVSDKVFWLVYDFGGGTFDAAVIQVPDGVIEVVNHGGDYHLGGKLIDWAIVDELLIPAVTREYRLSDFRRGNPKWRSAIAKLKLNAEEAKIRVSGSDSTEIIIDFLSKDDNGQPVSFEYELMRKDVERLAEPLILRSINICKKVLAEKRLDKSDVEKIILVGGPTMMPYLRAMLSDGLGIPLDLRVDPLTVVARGAAVFAGTQRLNVGPPKPVAEGQLGIELEYKPMGPDTDPLVGGKVVSTQVRDFSGFTGEFINASAIPSWRSGRIGLSPDGCFVTNVWAEKGHPNTFKIELWDPTGRRIKTMPDSFTYTFGMVITDQALIHSVGVATASNEMRWFFEKGSSLPLRRKEVLKTAFAVHQGKAGDVIRIPAMEGENRRADRNHKIGVLEVHAHEVKRDVPVGSDVEVTIEIDESRLPRVKAYIPILDEEYEKVMKLGYDRIDPSSVKKDFDHEKKRLEEIRRKSKETQDPLAQEILDRIDRECMVNEVEASLAAASADTDAAKKAENRLCDLKVALDQAEEAVEWPALVKEAEKLISASKEAVREHGDSADMRTLENHEAEVQKAIQTHDADILRKKVDDMRVFVIRVLDRKGIVQVIWFQELSEMKTQMRDQAMAEQLISEGQRAINNNDIDGLRAVNRQLATLLPSPPPPPDISTVI